MRLFSMGNYNSPVHFGIKVQVTNIPINASNLSNGSSHTSPIHQKERQKYWQFIALGFDINASVKDRLAISC